MESLSDEESQILSGVLAILRTKGDAQDASGVGSLIQQLVHATASREYIEGLPVSIFHQPVHGWDWRVGSDFAQGIDGCWYALVLQQGKAIPVE